MSNIEGDRPFRRAMGRALNLISYRQRSESELRRRLSEHHSEDAVDLTIDRLKEQGLIDDARFAREWSDSRTRAQPPKLQGHSQGACRQGRPTPCGRGCGRLPRRRDLRPRGRRQIRATPRGRRLRAVSPPPLGTPAKTRIQPLGRPADRLRSLEPAPAGVLGVGMTPQAAGTDCHTLLPISYLSQSRI